MFKKKYSSEKSTRYIELHKKITVEGFRFSGYFYTGDLSGKCECGKHGLAHNFVLTSPEGQDIILGSTCITKSEVQVYIFENHPRAWSKLQKELKLYKYLFRTIRTGDKSQEKITLEQLRELSKTIKTYWDTERDRRIEQAKEILPLLQAYSFLSGNPFLDSVLDQAINGSRGLSNRQIEVTEQIIDSYNEAKGTNEEEVLVEFEAKKHLPKPRKFEDDFSDVQFYLRLGRYDQETRTWLLGAIERYGTFNDSAYGKASRLLYKYRKQLNVHFWIAVTIPEEERTASALLYCEAFNGLVKNEIIPIMSQAELRVSIEGEANPWFRKHPEDLEVSLEVEA